MYAGMSACMYVFMREYLHVCMHALMSVCVCARTQTHARTLAHIHIYTHVHIHICMCIHTSIQEASAFNSMLTHLLHTHIHTYIHTYTGSIGLLTVFFLGYYVIAVSRLQCRYIHSLVQLLYIYYSTHYSATFIMVFRLQCRYMHSLVQLLYIYYSAECIYIHTCIHAYT